MDALKEAQLALPTDRVELRPGRVLAVHHRPSSSGSRDVAIFVHGSCASMVQWREQIENMAATGVSVVAYDFYGCGRSAKPQEWSCYAMDELYQDLVEVARRYGAVEALGGRNLVVAHSLGCSLALRMAAEWGTNGVNVSALALLGAMDAVPEAATGPLFRLPLCLLNWLQPLLSAGFETRALHEQTRLALTPEHQQLLRCGASADAPAQASPALRPEPPPPHPLPHPPPSLTRAPPPRRQAVRGGQRRQPDVHVQGVLPPDRGADRPPAGARARAGAAAVRRGGPARPRRVLAPAAGDAARRARAAGDTELVAPADAGAARRRQPQAPELLFERLRRLTCDERRRRAGCHASSSRRVGVRKGRGRPV